jgi:hypothetical protein
MRRKLTKPPTPPWTAIGMSRASWYRHGKPTTKPPRHITVAERAEADGIPLRTYQRRRRIEQSPFKEYVAYSRGRPPQGLVTLWEAEWYLSHPETVPIKVARIKRTLRNFGKRVDRKLRKRSRHEHQLD